MYGHLDKQPEFSGWRSDLGPWTPQYEGRQALRTRGADDGYAVYASIAAVQELKRQGVPHPRIVGLIETSEESGSRDLLPYIDALKTRLGDVALVVCLDSGAGNYDQLWLTTSLRGMASGTLKVEILTEGIHSATPRAWCPRRFRIMRQVLDRLEDSATGRLLPARFHCEVPAERWRRPAPPQPSWAKRCTGAFRGRTTTAAAPRVCAAHHDRPGAGTAQAHLGPTLSVTGADGFPALQDAGNVLRPTPPSSCPCACRRWWTPRSACRR